MFPLLLLSLFSSYGFGSDPNIVFVLMDDLGWYDVSFNGGQFPTPNIDDLKANSVELTSHYIHLMCSPSRTQILTGRYAMHQGIGKMLPWDYTEIGGIPIGQPTIANWLKEVKDYTTYAVGKWHCGYAYDGLTPTNKGFDHFFGFYQGAIHYDTLQYIDIKYGDTNHYDFWEDNSEYVLDVTSQHGEINSMYLYQHKIEEYIKNERIKQNNLGDDSKPFYMYLPLQTIHGPLNRIHNYVETCDKILGGNIPRRSKYCQNVLLTDYILGSIITSLKINNFWKNTLFIFTSDNGADISNKGCNYPLRGTKGTMFDGNTHTLALIGGGIIPQKQKGTTRDTLFSSLDWTPTLLKFAGILDNINIKDKTWDGLNQYELIMNNNNIINRDHIVFNIGLRSLNSATIIFKYNNILYKYIAEDSTIDQWLYQREDGWCVPTETNNWNIIPDDDMEYGASVNNTYLFDLTNDISEKTNLLKLSQNNKQNEELINYAKNLMIKYIEHPLYSEHLPFLWNRLPEGNPTLFGDGSYVQPFLTESQYLQHVTSGFNAIQLEYENSEDLQDITPFTDDLKNLYLTQWEVPDYLKSSDETSYIGSFSLGIVIIASLTFIGYCYYNKFHGDRSYLYKYSWLKSLDIDP